MSRRAMAVVAGVVAVMVTAVAVAVVRGWPPFQPRRTTEIERVPAGGAVPSSRTPRDELRHRMSQLGETPVDR